MTGAARTRVFVTNCKRKIIWTGHATDDGKFGYCTTCFEPVLESCLLPCAWKAKQAGMLRSEPNFLPRLARA